MLDDITAKATNHNIRSKVRDEKYLDATKVVYDLGNSKDREEMADLLMGRLSGGVRKPRTFYKKVEE